MPRDVLEARSLRLDEQAGELFLIGDPFEELETAGKVHALASRVQSIVKEIGEVDSDIRMSFRLGEVWEELENGEPRSGYVFLTGRISAYCFASAGVSLGVAPSLSLPEAERQRIEDEEKELPYQKKRRKAISRFVSAFLDKRALLVQRLLQKDLTPLTMGHIANLIQADMGSAIKDLVPKNQLTRFHRSINHPDVFKEQARHIVSEQDPPPNPMSWDEAREFTRDLAARWLEKKAGLPPEG